MAFTDELLDQIAAEGHWWLFLDYDGTLSPFAATPAEVLPDPDLIALLRRLANHPRRLRVVVLSGRRLDQVEKLVPLPGIILAGTYGIEYRGLEGQITRLLDAQELRPLLAQIRTRWLGLLKEKQGFYLEDKGWALALHAKNAPEEEALPVLESARESAAALIDSRSPFHLLEGPCFLEVAPKAAGKGQAVSLLLEKYGWPGAGLVYFGDDARDEEAFQVVQERGGIAVLVSTGSRPTAARGRLESPAAVRAWLADLERKLAMSPAESA